MHEPISKLVRMRWYSLTALGLLLAACGGGNPESSDETLEEDLRRGDIVVTRPLALTPTSAAAGTTVTGTVTYKNQGRRAGTIKALYITSRPPGGTEAAGPFNHFTPNLSDRTLKPGESVTLTASRAFTASDAAGSWVAYSTFQDGNGTWRNSPSVTFQVGTTPTDPVPPTPSSSLWSIAFYPGWVQNQTAPTSIDYTAFTHIFHFGMYPSTSGQVTLADMQSSAYPGAAVAAAHAKGKKIVLVIGGESTGPAFVGATSAANRATFVKNIVATMQKYGYDGVDIDWEEGVLENQLVPLLQELRTALDKVSPRPLLTLEVISGLVAPSIAGKVHTLLDSVNLMAYWSDGLDQVTAYRNAGVPAAKLVVGIGLPSVYRDKTQALVQAKVDLAKANGLRGVDVWQLGDFSGWTDARLIPLRALVGTTTPPPPAPEEPGPVNPGPVDPGPVTPPPAAGRAYPLHTGIISTTFWVGEIFDPNASDGSQVISTYDSSWMIHFGGCDGIASTGVCDTERRTAANGFFPTQMTPKENPFYLDLPFDDINDSKAYARRAQVIPWANDPGYAGHAKDQNFSYMKNRWVKLMKGGNTCYGQIQDAGPGQYNDAEYVFGSDDRRPLNKNFNNAGMDVSPALNGCLGFSDLNGQDDKVNWQFVDDVDVPEGPWKRVVTTRQVLNE